MATAPTVSAHPPFGGARKWRHHAVAEPTEPPVSETKLVNE